MYSNKVITSQKTLLFGSFLFLAFPCILFITTWVKLIFALISITAFLIVVKQFNATLGNRKHYSTLYLNEVVLLFILSLTIVLLSGVGDFASQIRDYIGHTAKIQDLVKYDWPFTYAKVNRYPCYYFGYYLAPAFFSKIFANVFITNVIWILWATLGMFFSMSLVYLYLQKDLKVLILSLFFSGSYSFVFYINQKFIHSNLLISANADQIYYVAYSIFGSAMWVPNQIIPSLLCAIVILISARNDNIKLPLFYISCSFFWAPFPTLIASLLYLLILFKKHYHVLNEFVSFVKIGILIFLFLAPIAIYLSATSSSGVSGFVWNYNADWFAILVGYLLSEIGFLFIAIFLITKFSAKLPEELSYLFYVSIIIFCLLCLTKYGVWNDLMARGNIPLMFIFSIYICSQIVHTKNFPKKVLLLVIYMLVTIPLLKIVFFQLSNNQLIGTMSKKTDTGDMYEVLVKNYSQQEGEQYLLKKDSFFEKYLLKK
ncbi:hypothetical protein [Flectobacillus rivi]|uniref:Glycosyltransferase RgtA/B/C/D-like domain-containing protein n=1 Tax=Flectobacillus rivi TaxID=2984209 RepID=A0ABT6Z3Q0_9BACT|nr:hypothetical protein [Flectobacillus rivi]MDI9875542.1 hypothetical protein [Flectobacillus rivi]